MFLLLASKTTRETALELLVWTSELESTIFQIKVYHTEELSVMLLKLTELLQLWGWYHLSFSTSVLLSFCGFCWKDCSAAGVRTAKVINSQCLQHFAASLLFGQFGILQQISLP